MIPAFASPPAPTRRIEPATEPRRDVAHNRMLVVDPRRDTASLDVVSALPSYLRPGDLLVVNDAATVPASVRAVAPSGRHHELRLTAIEPRPWAVLFGPGDWRTPTEHRAAPDRLRPGDRLRVEDGAEIEVLEVSPRSERLIRVRLADDRDALLERLYRLGRPVQYSYLQRSLRTADVQTPLATRPVAVEAPSASFALSWSLLSALRRRGVAIAPLTHAAGLSATSDPTLDAALPLPEAYEIPPATVHAIEGARRVIAAGTTVVRALEGSIAMHGRVVAGPGVTDLVIAPGFSPRIVDGLLSGVHDDDSSHHRIVGAFVPRPLTERALELAAAAGLANHEFGDSMLLLPAALRRR